MKRAQILYCLFVLLLITGKADASDFSEKLLLKAVKSAGKIWEGNEVVLKPLEHVPASQYFSSLDTLFILVNESSEHLGYLVVSSAKGRFDFFDFMIVYSLEPEVLEIKILVYRSEHGSQVTSKAWLKQFYGTPPGPDLQYGADIDALSGATLSAQSLTAEVNRLNRLMFELVKK